MALLPKPTKPSNQILVYLSGLFVAVLAGYYLVSKIDIVPDALSPIGYIDDIIILILAIFFVSKFIQRLRGRYGKTASAYKEMWRRGDLIADLAKPRTWLIIIILIALFSYVFWTLDVIPDGSPLGFVDDAMAAILALITIIRLYQKK